MQPTSGSGSWKCPGPKFGLSGQNHVQLRRWFQTGWPEPPGVSGRRYLEWYGSVLRRYKLNYRGFPLVIVTETFGFVVTETIRFFPEVRCSTLTHLENGYITGSETHYKAVVMFYCNHDAFRVGEHFATCKKDGNWSNPLPKCLSNTFPQQFCLFFIFFTKN